MPRKNAAVTAPAAVPAAAPVASSVNTSTDPKVVEMPVMTLADIRKDVRLIVSGYGKVTYLARALLAEKITPAHAFVAFHKDFLGEDDKLTVEGAKVQQALRMALRRPEITGSKDRMLSFKMDKENQRCIVGPVQGRGAGAGRPSKNPPVPPQDGEGADVGESEGVKATKPGTGLTAEELISRVAAGITSAATAFEGDEENQRKLVDAIAKALNGAGCAVTIEPNF